MEVWALVSTIKFSGTFELAQKHSEVVFGGQSDCVRDTGPCPLVHMPKVGEVGSI
jgi:hypothetical protein